MVVCPTCRAESAEDAKFCSACGRSLDPVAATLRSRPPREEADDPDLDIPPPKEPRAWPALILLGLILLVAAGGATYYILRPQPVQADPCEGKFRSSILPYCVNVPSGWEPRQRRTRTEVLDAYVAPSQQPVVLVSAGEVLPGATANSYAQDLRSTQEAVGLQPGPPRRLILGGRPAWTWQWSTEVADGTIVQQREVVTVIGTVSFHIQYVGETEAANAAWPIFVRMLGSWRWIYGGA